MRAQAATMHNASESNLKNCCVPTAAARKKIPLPLHPPTLVAKKKMKRHRSTEEFHKALERTEQRMKATQQHNRGGWQPIVHWKYDSNEWTQISARAVRVGANGTLGTKRKSLHNMLSMCCALVENG